MVPRKEGGTLKKKFVNCSRTEVRAAIKRLRGASDGGDDIPPADEQEVKSLRFTFGNVIGQNSPARFRAVYSNGMTLVSLESMPVQDVWQICQALGHPPWPAPEPEQPQVPAARAKRPRRQGR